VILDLGPPLLVELGHLGRAVREMEGIRFAARGFVVVAAPGRIEPAYQVPALKARFLVERVVHLVGDVGLVVALVGPPDVGGSVAQPPFAGPIDVHGGPEGELALGVEQDREVLVGKHSQRGRLAQRLAELRRGNTQGQEVGVVALAVLVVGVQLHPRQGLDQVLFLRTHSHLLSVPMHTSACN
jgi:hypothetical protein